MAKVSTPLGDVRDHVRKIALNVHMIGNAHMDPVWIWDWREGFGEVWATFRSALDRLNESPDVTFTASSAAYYAWIEHHDPAMFAEIQAAVASRRWSIVGGMWIEPDCNIPSGESLSRQLLLGQRYFHRTFGRITHVGYNIDSFGHAAGLSNLLRQSGLRSYVMMRPGANEQAMPATAFRWTDPSGGSLPTYRIVNNYETDTVAVLSENALTVIALADAESTPQMCFFGIGNHGGGPTRTMIKAIDALTEENPRFRFSTPELYFDELEAMDVELPIVSGELQHHAVGCYSASGWVKAANRAAEVALLDAEVFDTVASQIVQRTPTTGEIEKAWEELALCQFHDILAGTSSEEAYRTVRSRFGYVESIADQVTTNALYELAHRVDTRVATIRARERESIWSRDPESATPFVVQNPLAWPVTQIVKASRHATRVLNHLGDEIPFQSVSSGESTVYRTHTLFSVELEPLGYEVFWLQGSTADLTVLSPTSTSQIQTERFRVEVNEASGAITSIVDRISQVELLGNGGIRPIVLSDISDTWSHGLVRYEGEPVPVTFEGWENIDEGSLRTTLRLRFRCGASRLIEDVMLFESAPYIELRLRAQWEEAQSVVKLVMPWLLGPNVSISAGASYSFQDRSPTGEEDVFQGWLDAYDVTFDRGVGITSDHLYGYDAIEGVVRLTVLRNPLAADHGRGWAQRIGEDFPLTDGGQHDIRLRIYPHAGNWREARLPQRADEHHRPPVVVAETYHEGSLPGRGSFMCVEPLGIAVVKVVKRAASGEGVVLRLVEAVGVPISLTVSGELLGRAIVASLQPYEVQTLLVPDDHTAPARVVSLAELEILESDEVL